MLGKTGARHTSEQVVAFLADIVASADWSGNSRNRRQPVGVQDHREEAFLSEHPTVHLRFAPNYSSWMNQVKPWFAKISRDVITRGVFSSVAELKSKLMPYIQQYNKNLAS